jgi:hypothetical protein
MESNSPKIAASGKEIARPKRMNKPGFVKDSNDSFICGFMLRDMHKVYDWVYFEKHYGYQNDRETRLSVPAVPAPANEESRDARTWLCAPNIPGILLAPDCKI